MVNYMWIIRNIDESDYGCEERMPGEPLIVIVELESDEGETCELEIAEDFLTVHDLDEGDEWPLDMDSDDDKSIRQNEWMDNYLDAIEELSN